MSHPVKKRIFIGAAAAFAAAVAIFGMVSWHRHDETAAQTWKYTPVPSVKITDPTAP